MEFLSPVSAPGAGGTAIKFLDTPNYAVGGTPITFLDPIEAPGAEEISITRGNIAYQKFTAFQSWTPSISVAVTAGQMVSFTIVYANSSAPGSYPSPVITDNHGNTWLLAYKNDGSTSNTRRVESYVCLSANATATITVQADFNANAQRPSICTESLVAYTGSGTWSLDTTTGAITGTPNPSPAYQQGAYTLTTTYDTGGSGVVLLVATSNGSADDHGTAVWSVGDRVQGDTTPSDRMDIGEIINTGAALTDETISAFFGDPENPDFWHPMMTAVSVLCS